MSAAPWAVRCSMLLGVPSLGVTSRGVIILPSAGALASRQGPSPQTVHPTPPAAAGISPPLPVLWGPEMLSARHCLISSRTLLGRSPRLGSRDATALGPGTIQITLYPIVASRLGLPAQEDYATKLLTRRRPGIERRRLGAHLCLLDCSMQVLHRPLCTGPPRQARPGTDTSGRVNAGECRMQFLFLQEQIKDIIITIRGLKLTHGLADRLVSRGSAGPCRHVSPCQMGASR